ncbi:MAG: ABC transporter permease [Dehalococcoidia bacterium]|nr:ABC transporter permease [Dehalococcoidia bacterium]
MATAGATGVIPAELEQPAPAVSRGRRIGVLIRQNPLGFFGLVVVLVLAAFAVFAPLIAPYDPDAIGAGATRANPSLEHFFGTDDLGRDMFSRVGFGARISLAVGFLSVIFGTLIGTAIGIFSGYVGGAIDNLIQRTVDTAIAFPALLLLLILRQVLGPSLQTLIIAIGIAIIPGVARVVRGAVLSESNNQYVEAARAIGASTLRILFRHIAPNIAALAIIIATTLLGTAILAEAALAFLGLGIPSAVTWGGDVSAGRNSFPIHIWWPFFPGAAITLTVLGFNLLGDSLRDILDPRLRGRL